MRKIRNIVCIAAMAAAFACLTGCSVMNGVTYVYENADKYEVGDRKITDKIDTINIDYVSGDIVLGEADTDSVSITETAKREMNDKQKVHTWVDGSTLYVKYCASGKNIDMHDLEKKLTIDLPQGTELSDLTIDVSSGDVDAACTAKNINVDASSGDITVNQKGSSDNIDIETSSGEIALTVETATKVSTIASSGNITINGNNVKDLTSEASSGTERFTFAQVPETSDIEASSGDVTITIPKDADLSAHIETSSGDVNSEHSFTTNDNNYVSGEGKNKMTLETSSGDVYIKNLLD